jgi:putative RNA 2'-phosphotransferase
VAYNQQTDKVRWQIDPAQRRMRATHGHSFSVMQDREPSIPPPVLYHGTAAHTVEAILCEGIRPMQRQFVHLSTTPAAAMQVGGRHGQPVLLRIHTEPLVAKGQLFYQTGETIWLTSAIAPEYVD